MSCASNYVSNDIVNIINFLYSIFILMLKLFESLVGLLYMLFFLQIYCYSFITVPCSIRNNSNYICILASFPCSIRNGSSWIWILMFPFWPCWRAHTYLISHFSTYLYFVMYSTRSCVNCFRSCECAYCLFTDWLHSWWNMDSFAVLLTWSLICWFGEFNCHKLASHLYCWYLIIVLNGNILLLSWSGNPICFSFISYSTNPALPMAKLAYAGLVSLFSD